MRRRWRPGDAGSPNPRGDGAPTADPGLAIETRTAIAAPEPAEIGLDQEFRGLVDSVTEYAIVGLDLDGRVRTWNEGAQRIKGYRAEEIVGYSFSRFYPPEDVAGGKPQRDLELAIVEGRHEEEGWRVRKDGSRFWASVVTMPIRSSSGSLQGFAKITRDLTHRKLMQDSLTRSQEQERIGAVLQGSTIRLLFSVGLELQPLAEFSENPGHRGRFESLIQRLDDGIVDLRRFVFNLDRR